MHGLKFAMRSGVPVRRVVAPTVAAFVLALQLAGTPARADLPLDQIRTHRLPAAPGAHWVWVSDVVGYHLEAGKSFLLDGDRGEMLGMLSTGVLFMALALPADYSRIYSPETYYSRGVRGRRDDIVSIYDPQSLMPIGEIDIPEKRGTNFPTGFNSTLTDDDRFLLVYNFAPAQSVSVVDTKSGGFAGEIETPGCALVYPAGARRFFMLCADGAVLTIELDEAGRARSNHRSVRIFDPQRDPIQEDGVRSGSQWLFVSYDGYVRGIDVAGERPSALTPWSLLTDADRAAGWRTGGGMQLVDLHAPTQRLYVLMNQAGRYGQDDPASEIWIYDLGTHARLQRIEARQPASSLRVTTDAAPLLFTVFPGRASVEVYDALSGRHLRSIEEVAASPMILQLPRRR